MQTGGFIARKTVAKYIDRTATEMEKELIAKELSCDGEHYTAVVATWTNRSGGVYKRLLACGVQDTIITDASNFGFSEDDTGDYLLDVLSKYDRSFESIDFLSGDNYTVNGSLATKITTHPRAKNIIKLVPLVGCASHRLNLGIRLFYEAPNSTYYALVNKVNDPKNKYKLAAKTKLNPVKRNDTRWGSTYAMIERCRELRDILPTLLKSWI